RRLRGHAPAHPRPHQDPHPHRLRAQGAPRRDPRPGDHVFHVGQGAALTGVRDHFRKLLAHSAVYGTADVFTMVVNMLLTPLYVLYLSPADYGDIALLLVFSALAKIVFRMGLDNGFFRVYYDLEPQEQPRFAGTVWLFAAASSTLLFAG